LLLEIAQVVVKVPKLFWLVYGEGANLTLFIQPAEMKVYALLKASMAGIKGEYTECYELSTRNVMS
jgi:hypothetical protein